MDSGFGLVFEEFDEDCPPVTDLQEMFELDGKTIFDILAIYMSKRSGSKNRKGRKWSPSAACLIASLMKKVPEHFVQQVVAHWEEKGPSIPCHTYVINQVSFVKIFVNDERLKMERYFKDLNEAKKKTWYFDEINHREELVQELSKKVRSPLIDKHTYVHISWMIWI